MRLGKITKTGSVEIVADMTDIARNLHCSIDVPVIVVDLCDPNRSANFDVLDIGVQRCWCGKIKSGDIYVIKTDITGRRQGSICDGFKGSG